MLPSFLISHMGGGGMVDRYMGCYVGYGVVYLPVLRCCMMWCVRQSHCRGSTVRFIVFALVLGHSGHKLACRSIRHTDKCILAPLTPSHRLNSYDFEQNYACSLLLIQVFVLLLEPGVRISLYI